MEPENHRTDDAFFQERVASFGFAAGTLNLAALAIRIPEEARHGLSCLLHPSMVAHAAAGVILMGAWLACRGKARSRHFVEHVDAIALIGSSTASAWMGSAIPVFGAEYIALLAMTYAVVMRAIMVPSTPQRTMVISGLSGLGLFLLLRDVPSVPRDHLLPPRLGGAFPVVVSFIWWAFSVVVATSASRTIYGLRQKVSEAQKVGQYTLEEKIGEGGMGVVYRAKHGLLRRPTAIKLLPAARAGARAVARFEREVQLTATLSHPNTITVFDYGRTPDGTFYYAMELLEGETLQDIVTAAGPMPPSRVVHVLSQVVGALAEAHDAGLVHRDVKPANVVLCERGGLADVVKVLDFGIVRDRAEATATTPGERITGLLGTPYYVSPEGILNANGVTASSDLYALGALAYFLLTGAPPFPAGTLVEVCAHHVQTVPTPPSARVATPIPDALERLVLDCLAKKPEDRPPSARAVGEVLASCGVAAWTQAQARACWALQGEKIRESRSRSRVTNTPDVMAVSIEVAARLPLDWRSRCPSSSSSTINPRSARRSRCCSTCTTSPASRWRRPARRSRGCVPAAWASSCRT